MIKTVNLSKEYKIGRKKTVKANDNISISLNNGVIGLFGQNGSGKTTLLRQIAGIAEIGDGDIIINGTSIKKSSEFKREISYMSQTSYAALWNLKVKDAIQLTGRLMGLSSDEVKTRYKDFKNYFEIENIEKQKFGSLSGGYKKLIIFIITMLKTNNILILDEPSNEIDPYRRRLLWRMILNLKTKDRIIFMATHNIAEVQGLIDNVIILKNGKVVLDRSKNEIMSSFDNKLKIEIERAEIKNMGLDEDMFCLVDERLNKAVYHFEKKHLKKVLDLVEQNSMDYLMSKIGLEDVCFNYFKEVK